MGTASFSRDVKRALDGTGTIAKSDVLRWIHDGDLMTRSREFHLTASAWSRIQPELTMDEQCEFIADYLLECIASNPSPSRVTITCTPAIVRELYRSGDEATRTRIETGALEHILEKRSLRPYFSDWKNDPALREGYERALVWGLAHTDKSNPA